MNGKIKLGFIPANRGFFSSKLAAAMRKETVDALEKLGIGVVVPSEQQTEVGCVSTLAEADLAAELFRRENVDGLLIGCVNFGEETAVARTVKKAGLDVPILLFGCHETETLTMRTERRDAFCGLLSQCDVLRQLGVKYTLARTPICFPREECFAKDIDWFARICRVVKGVKNARYAQIGARPEAFWTCRYSEKKLQRLGPTSVVLDLSEALAGAKSIPDGDPELLSVLEATKKYADCSGVEPQSVVRSAKFELFLRRFQKEHGIDAFGIQCWNSIQQNYGCCTCTAMSRLGNEGTPCACESDLLGTLSMHAAMLASGSPAGLGDWNNLHNNDSELANIWHCGVFPAAFAKTPIRLGTQEIMVEGGGAKREDAQGTIEFVARPGPVTLFRVTQDPDSNWHAAVIEGAFEDNPACTFGCYGWCRIPNLQRLYREVLLRQFPHHVAITQSHIGNVLWEAFGNYLGMSMYHAGQYVPGLYTTEPPF